MYLINIFLWLAKKVNNFRSQTSFLKCLPLESSEDNETSEETYVRSSNSQPRNKVGLFFFNFFDCKFGIPIFKMISRFNGTQKSLVID